MSDELFNDLKIILLELPFQLKAHLRNNHIVSTGVFEIKYHSIAQKKQRMVPPRERAAAGNCRSNCRIQWTAKWHETGCWWYFGCQRCINFAVRQNLCSKFGGCHEQFNYTRSIMRQAAKLPGCLCRISSQTSVTDAEMTVKPCSLSATHQSGVSNLNILLASLSSFSLVMILFGLVLLIWM